MLYAKVVDGVIKKYPYSQTDLIRENTNVSFPNGLIPTATLVDYDVLPVHFSAAPNINSRAERLVELQPVNVDGAWVQQWAVEPLTDDEISAMNTERATTVRAERNRLLIESDWTQLVDAPCDSLAWANYRQALRELPSQPGFPWDIVWPTLPE